MNLNHMDKIYAVCKCVRDVCVSVRMCEKVYVRVCVCERECVCASMRMCESVMCEFMYVCMYVHSE